MSVNQSKCASCNCCCICCYCCHCFDSSSVYGISIPLFFYMVLICKPHQPIELSILSHLGKMNLMRRTEGTSMHCSKNDTHWSINYLKIFYNIFKCWKTFQILCTVCSVFKSPPVSHLNFQDFFWDFLSDFQRLWYLDLHFHNMKIIFGAYLKARPIVHDVVFVLLLLVLMWFVLKESL